MNDPIPANVEWNKIPHDARVKDLGSSFVVTFADGRKAIAFWGSTDAGRAQSFLRRRAILDLMPG